MKEDYKKRFINGLRMLERSRSPYQVWSDCMTLFSITISNAAMTPLKEFKPFGDVWNSREKEYLNIINKYNEHERKLLPQMFTLLVKEIMRNPNQDLLGEIYMMAGISNKNAGQFFTPYNVCQAMTGTVMNRKEVGKKVHKQGYISIYDPTCGAGATLIAAIEECRKMFKKLDFTNHVYFAGQDVDSTVAKMCYIQLSLQGVAGYVQIGNTLEEPIITSLEQTWFTPIWFSDVWTMRRLFHNQDIFGRRSDEKRNSKAIIDETEDSN